MEWTRNAGGYILDIVSLSRDDMFSITSDKRTVVVKLMLFSDV
jgi:hypothetical protein